MNTHKLFITLILSAAGLIPAAAQNTFFTDTVTLSLDSCISIALSDNPSIHVADMEVTRMDYSRKEVLGQLLPSVSFGGTYNRTLAKQTMYMNMGSLGGNTGDDPDSSESAETSQRSNGIKVGLDNSYSVGFQASLPLIAPQLWKSLKLSDSQILQSLESARKSRIEMVNQVKNAYYSLLLAEDSYRTVMESYDMARITADAYAKQYQVGAASEYDVLRTEVAVKNVEPDITQAKIAIRQARLQLCILMGLDAEIAIRPDVSLASYERDMYDNALDALMESENITRNADLRLLDIQTRQLRDALEVQKMSLMPTLALSANYNWTSMSNGSPFRNFRWNPYSSIGLTLTIPLYEGGQRYNRIRAAKLQVEEMSWQRASLVRSINMQTKLAVENIQLNIKQIASCAESMKQADKAYNIMHDSFNLGAASYLDMRDSELALTRSRLAYYQSIYNYLVAHSDLELLLGTAPIEKYGVNNSTH
ncbi:MAG: TolC family protein [Muribaculaceae bacterium]|nr:TolC family protein [Muribaculaceae bacterium]